MQKNRSVQVSTFLSHEVIERQIYLVRGKKVMLDRDLANLYGVTTGNLNKAQALHHKLFSLCRALFVETNPIPVKRAMKLLGYCGDELRLPLCKMSESNEKILVKAMKDYGLSMKG